MRRLPVGTRGWVARVALVTARAMPDANAMAPGAAILTQRRAGTPYVRVPHSPVVQELLHVADLDVCRCSYSGLRVLLTATTAPRRRHAAAAAVGPGTQTQTVVDRWQQALLHECDRQRGGALALLPSTCCHLCTLAVWDWV